jgi:hypothetical protein
MKIVYYKLLWKYITLYNNNKLYVLSLIGIKIQNKRQCYIGNQIYIQCQIGNIYIMRVKKGIRNFTSVKH